MNPVRALVRYRLVYRLMLRSRVVVEWSERLLRRVTRGRWGVMDLVGMDSIRITVPGRRTGLPRTCTLQYVPDGDRYLVLGSNWGRAGHPMWSVNFIAADEADVTVHGESFRASLVHLTGSERERAWRTILATWPNYRIARDLAGGREFRIFALRRLDSTP